MSSPFARDAESSIPCLDQTLLDLAIGGEAHHQLRNPVREIVAVVLPSMEGLAVRAYKILKVSTLCKFRDPRCDKNS